MYSMRHRLPWMLALALGLELAMLLPAAAQLGSSLPNAGNIATGRRNGGTPEKPPLAEPDAVPGAKPRSPVAPSTKSMTDLSPNDALFDAINRGDITSARDALSRGADLGAVNVLGMTPMELSVDLGRNDISFLLLSMRGEDSGRGSRAVARSLPPAGSAAPETKKVVASRPPVAARLAETSKAATQPVPPPKLFAGDGGTPLPSAGFLGFGSRQSAN